MSDLTPQRPLLELRHIDKSVKSGRTTLNILQDVSLQVQSGEIICLVGESGCGKTTTGKIAAGLLDYTGGDVLYDGKSIAGLRGEDYREFRKAVQIVHQDPYASLNPVHTIFRTLSFPLFRHNLAHNEREARAKVLELLELVDLEPAVEFIDKFPHQLSGGQRQRVSIARALTVNPRVIVADEAVSMVDVSIRISLLNTLSNLQKRLGLTFVFITHDLAVARYFAWEGRIAVMYLGRIVEVGSAQSLTDNPQHPYTKALISALPEPDPDVTRSKERYELKSQDIPSLTRIPTGCAFHPRCPIRLDDLCPRVRPEMAMTPGATLAACHVTEALAKAKTEVAQASA